MNKNCIHIYDKLDETLTNDLFISVFKDVTSGAFEIIDGEIKDEDYPINSMVDLVELLRDYSNDYEEDTDSCYITTYYRSTTKDKKYTLELVGSSYRKDQCICDEEMEPSLTITDNEAHRENTILTEESKWSKMFKACTSLESLQYELVKYKFPEKL